MIDDETWAEIERHQEEIRAKNGVAPGVGIPCTRCEKMVRSDDDGHWWCDCWDERPGPEAQAIRDHAIKKGWVVPIHIEPEPG